MKDNLTKIYRGKHTYDGNLKYGLILPIPNIAKLFDESTVRIKITHSGKNIFTGMNSIEELPYLKWYTDHVILGNIFIPYWILKFEEIINNDDKGIDFWLTMYI